jgi:hypothetical protein
MTQLELMVDSDPCMRTFALYKPGVPLPSVRHSYAWTGRVPCTGVLRCILCGKTKWYATHIYSQRKKEML